MTWNIFTGRGTIRFSRGTLLHGVTLKNHVRVQKAGSVSMIVIRIKSRAAQTAYPGSCYMLIPPSYICVVANRPKYSSTWIIHVVTGPPIWGLGSMLLILKEKEKNNKIKKRTAPPTCIVLYNNPSKGKFILDLQSETQRISSPYRWRCLKTAARKFLKRRLDLMEVKSARTRVALN